MARITICIFLLPLTLTFFLLCSASSERHALLTFKASITDPMSFLSSWSNNTDVHHCNWTGITCTPSPSLSVTSINLQAFNLSGEISPTICELTNLTLLRLADNFFNQPIPLHLSQCASLETLSLSNNLIWGTIPDQISQFSSLRVLDLSKNHLEGRIPDGIGSLKKLQVLSLGSNLLSGTLPSVFGNFTELVILDLSANPFLMSEIPPDLGKLMKLEQLLLQRADFQGNLPESLEGLHGLTILDLSQNNLSGLLPRQLGVSLKNLISFDVSENNFLGSFPNGICFAKGLVNISLSSNQFSGSIPESINKCMNLERFEVQNNHFTGDFPAGLWSLPKIRLIRAENNRLSGNIPDSISMAAQLEQVQIDNNRFRCQIPHGVGLVKSLYKFSASMNHLYGELPPNFCDSPVMSILNLSHNSLSGNIPPLTKCKKLVSLSLADNSLFGNIPESLGELPVLTYLDLSENYLTGLIPQEFQNLKLALFNVSFNRLSGRVPPSLVSGLPASFLQGNLGLCGPGLPGFCAAEKQTLRVAGLSALTWVVISIALILGISTIVVFIVLRVSSKHRSQMGLWRPLFFYPLRVTENDLVMSMSEKSALGNGSTFGRVYLINLPSGEQIAVKKLLKFDGQSSKSLKAEVKTLAKIRHKNVAKVLGFCHSDESVFLIYEFLPNGSLGDLISRPDFQLPWSVRLKIAIGVAQGLKYLHKDYAPQILHRNVTTGNILLDAEYEPKLTDFALDRVIGELSFQSTIAQESASSCYIAPEYGFSKKGTEYMDIYSYGVVLLQLVTGRPAYQLEGSENSVDIVKWVRRKINITNGEMQVLDQKISGPSRQEMIRVLEIAQSCTNIVPEKRPSMAEIVRALCWINFQNVICEKVLNNNVG